MTFYIFLCFLLVMQKINTQEVDCEKIKPTSPSDCKLSQNDKTAFFPKKYCCYEKDISEFKCKAYDDLDFELLKDDECYNETNTNIPNTCEFINPSKASDCVLSESEKTKYDFCCYLVDGGEKSCSAETQESYEVGYELFKAFATKEDIFECKNNNRAGYIYLRLIYLMIIILFM